MAKLPSEYQEVEYIESTGTQYIDTNIKGSNDLEVEVSVMLKQEGSIIFGSINENYVRCILGLTDTNLFSFCPGGFINQGNAEKDVLYNIKANIIKPTASLYVNNELISSLENTIPDAGNNYNIYLFARNNAGTVDRFALIRLYGNFKIVKAGVTVRNLVPCYRKTDNEIGMYDLVNDVFYTNQGSGIFSKGADVNVKQKFVAITQVNKLPNEYQEVEYIESTGTQYIDTGYTPTSTFGFDLEINVQEPIASTGHRVFGSSRRMSGQWGGIMLSAYNYADGGQFCAFNRNTYCDAGLVQNSKVNISFKGRTYATSTGVSYTFQTGSTSDVFGSVYIFNLHCDEMASTGVSARVYSCKLYDGAVLVRHFIPCYRKSDSVIGMYDIVNGVFYANAGTGTFLKGNNVYHKQKFVAVTQTPRLPKEYQEVEYIEGTGTQYIDTELTTFSDITLTTKISHLIKNIEEPANTFITGSNDAKNHRMYLPYLITNDNYWYVGYGSVTASTTKVYLNTLEYIVLKSINNVGEQKFYINDDLIYSNNINQSFSSNFHLMIFGQTYGGMQKCTNIAKCRLYYWKAETPNGIIRDMVPCYRKSDNVIGMFDLVTKVFFTNRGTGTFIKGNDIYGNTVKQKFLFVTQV